MAYISKSRLKKLFILSEDSIKKAIKSIDEGERRISLVVESHEKPKILATITDGDIRRAIVAGNGLDQSVQKLLETRQYFHSSGTVTAKADQPDQELLAIMKKEMIRQIPILDDQGMVIDLVTIEDLQPREELPMKALIMAGGEGIRLRPLTNDLPKPMLPIGNQPLLELIVNELRDSGIRDVNISLGYKKEKIVEHFRDGKTFGVDINYFSEDEPLGTAGAIGLMGNLDKPTLVINGDILTNVDFRGMLNHHQKNNAAITVGVRWVDFEIPFGVVECTGINVAHLKEKPTYTYLVNAGVYIVDPRINSYIQQGQHIDMTDLIQCLLDNHEKVIQYPIVEYWMDIGQYHDYQKVQKDVLNRKNEEENNELV